MTQLPTFHNQQLFEQAFTHRSFLNEAKEKVESNERLEFLGDSILSFVVSDYLFNTYPEYNEGILTNLRSLLVNTKSLASLAREYEFGQYLKLSKGEEESKGRENESLLANCFEAYLGALFLDSGIEAVRQFLHDSIIPKIEGYVEKKAFKDPKSLLQEFVQGQKQSSPFYKVLNEEGPPHAKTFTIGVIINNEVCGEGTGKSKQEAEENAAKEALIRLKTTEN
jgi:ribonuclease III